MAANDRELELADSLEGPSSRGTALERFRKVSHALSDAARRSRLSGKRGLSMGPAGYGRSRGATIARWLTILSFVLLVAVPTLAAGAYYLFVAADQYVSEADFIVASGDRPATDSLGALTGVPLVAVIQDTQIVVNYIHSRAALELLDKKARVRDLYSSAKLDYFSRFEADSPIEKFVKYWRKMSDVSIVMPAGIVQLKVRAFTPEGARDVARAALEICEALVNDINGRMNRDAVASAEQELRRTSQRLSLALGALETARNEAGILETSKSADAIVALAKEVRLSLLSMQGQYESQLKNVLPTAPQMRELSSRIEVTKKQLAEIESKLTTLTSDAADPSIAKSMTKFGELDLERQVAERLYAGAAASLEIARLNAESKQMYLKTFVTPVAPEEAQYPKRGLNTFLVFVVSLIGWGVLMGLAALVRTYLT